MMRGFETRGNGGLPPFQGLEGTLVFPPSTGAFIKWGIVALAIVAVIMQMSVYAGVPAAMSALMATREVFVKSGVSIGGR